jgi:alpha-glucosidase
VYFKDVVEPLEADGADFFWLDWQQWLMAKGVSGLSNTFWLNHLFATHDANRRNGEKRPIIYHRWGGLGSHRYQIGFSGDGRVSWSMLEAIPWFTASASNVGYGYWGHDLGGHMKPEGEDGANGELYTRWMQTGVFTPIFRTHTTKDRRLERRIWKFADHFLTLREAFRLRYRLAPYIYTAAREAYDTGVSMCRPMYYDWPENDCAYAATNAFMFGENILVAPVSKPVDALTHEAEIDVWLPKGTWYDVSKGELVEGGRNMRRGYRVEETPWFVKSGAVIPMYPDSVNRLGNPGTDDLVLFCAPGGGASRTSIYEDGGDNADYATNFRRTEIRREESRVAIGPRKGAYMLKFPLAAPPRAAKVNGRTCAWEYDAEDLAVVIKTPPQDGTRETVVELVYPDAEARTATFLSGLKGECARVTALTEDFRKALAGNGPESRRTRPEYVANLPDSWQTYWKTRDAVAANPSDAKRILKERDAALRTFAADFRRMEPGIPDADFCRRMHIWLTTRGVER